MVSKMKKALRVLSLFDGMSCAQIALKNLKIPCIYYASETDEYAIKTTQKNFPNTIQVGDITKLSYGIPPLFFNSIGKKPNTTLLPCRNLIKINPVLK